MNASAMLLALAPAATAVASRTAAAAQNIGESFASMFAGASDSANRDAVSAAGPTLREALESLANEFRGWLNEHGVRGDYAVDYHMASDGQSQVSVSGDGAQEVEQLLASNPSWMDRLRQLASSAQAEFARRTGSFTSSPLSIEIDAMQPV